MVWIVCGHEWPFDQSRKLGLHAGNFGTRFGQSWTDLGLKNDVVLLLDI